MSNFLEHYKKICYTKTNILIIIDQPLSKTKNYQNNKAMATSEERRHEFKINSVFTAVISKINDDRVFFEITRVIFTKNGPQTITETAAFFVKGHMFNPHQVFHKGQDISVIVNKICKPPKNFYGLTYLVTPTMLPADEFIALHPVGSRVSGTITEVHGATMTVLLADNVMAVTKRCRHARSGKTVDCKIDNFRRQKISLRVLA